MYFELTEDNMVDYGIKEPENLPYELVFISGGMISPEVEMPFEFTTKAKVREDVPDFWNTAMPIMSKKFVEMLEKAGVDNLQKFPAVVKSLNTNFTWDDFYAVNIIGKIRCANLNASTYNEIFPGGYSFKELAIDASIPKDALLFRLQESASTIILHQSVGAYIMENDPDELLKGWDVHEIIQ